MSNAFPTHEELRNDNARLRAELTKSEAATKTHCLDWAEDHTHLQELCLKAGFSEDEVYGDSYGVPCIMDLAEMLSARLAQVAAERDALAKHVAEMKVVLSALLEYYGEHRYAAEIANAARSSTAPQATLKGGDEMQPYPGELTSPPNSAQTDGGSVRPGSPVAASIAGEEMTDPSAFGSSHAP